MEVIHLIMEHWFLAILFIAAIPIVINLIYMVIAGIVVSIVAAIISIALMFDIKEKGELK